MCITSLKKWFITFWFLLLTILEHCHCHLPHGHSHTWWETDIGKRIRPRKGNSLKCSSIWKGFNVVFWVNVSKKLCFVTSQCGIFLPPQKTLALQIFSLWLKGRLKVQWQNIFHIWVLQCIVTIGYNPIFTLLYL